MPLPSSGALGIGAIRTELGSGSGIDSVAAQVDFAAAMSESVSASAVFISQVDFVAAIQTR